MDGYAIAIVAIAVVVVIVLGNYIKTPVKKVLAKVVKKGELSKRRVQGKFGFHTGLNWIVVFQEVDSGREIELEVGGFKYEELQVGQVGVLTHRFDSLMKFEISK